MMVLAKERLYAVPSQVMARLAKRGKQVSAVTIGISPLGR